MLINEPLVKRVITPRPKISHKGTFGRIVLIGGNEQYGGAIIMSALAAVHSGTGLTTVVTDEKNRSALHSHLPEAMIVDWTDTDQFLSVIKQANVLLIGPGLGTSSKSLERFKQVLENQSKEQWLVIDGSALSLLAANHLLLPYPEQTVLTPHQMEWQRLSSLPIQEQRDEENKKKQQEIGAVLVLKSHETKIYGHQHFYTNPLGSAAMATGGMGDTLAGMITGFLAQFPQNDQTIAAAVYLHSFIGDQLAKEQYIVLPTQISEAFPKWMNYFCKKSMENEA